MTKLLDEGGPHKFSRMHRMLLFVLKNTHPFFWAVVIIVGAVTTFLPCLACTNLFLSSHQVMKKRDDPTRRTLGSTLSARC